MFDFGQALLPFDIQDTIGSFTLYYNRLATIGKDFLKNGAIFLKEPLFSWTFKVEILCWFLISRRKLHLADASFCSFVLSCHMLFVMQAKSYFISRPHSKDEQTKWIGSFSWCNTNAYTDRITVTNMYTKTYQKLNTILEYSILESAPFL